MDREEFPAVPAEGEVKIQLTLHGINLGHATSFITGASNRHAVVNRFDPDDGENVQFVGKTETIKKTKSAAWSQKFDLGWFLGEPLHIRVDVYEEIKGKDVCMGKCTFEIGDIISSEGNTRSKLLDEGRGTIYAHVGRDTDCDDKFCFQLRASKLIEMSSLFGSPDPYFTISRKHETSTGEIWNVVYRSEFINNNLSPTWKHAKLSMNALCGGDTNTNLRIEVHNHNLNEKHTVMGQMEITVNRMLEARRFDGKPSARGFPLVLTKGMLRAGSIEVFDAVVEIRLGKFINPGTNVRALPDVVVPGVVVSPPAETRTLPDDDRPADESASFLKYLSGGCKLKLCVAIDFTASNGDPRNPKSLHYIGKDGNFNEYEKAIDAVGSILIQYDSDHKVPVWGFGVKLNGEKNNCFQCGKEVEPVGVTGILDAYRSVFQHPIMMSGPTEWSAVIRNAAKYAVQDESPDDTEQVYTVLLILSDGTFESMDETIRAMDAAKTAPLSVVVVGVGAADFTDVRKTLDDAGPSDDTIVTFVDYREHSHCMSSLTREALSRIPDQLCRHFEGRGVAPLPMPAHGRDGVCARGFADYDDLGSTELAPVPLPVEAGAGEEISTVSVAAPKGGRQFVIEIPRGVRPGSTVRVKSPIDGRIVEVVVPDGTVPGGYLGVQTE